MLRADPKPEPFEALSASWLSLEQGRCSNSQMGEQLDKLLSSNAELQSNLDCVIRVATEQHKKLASLMTPLLSIRRRISPGLPLGRAMSYSL